MFSSGLSCICCIARFGIDFVDGKASNANIVHIAWVSFST